MHFCTELTTDTPQIIIVLSPRISVVFLIVTPVLCTHARMANYYRHVHSYNSKHVLF